MAASKALFLDRDGVINVDHGYVSQPGDFEFMPGIFELCQRFQQRGYKIVIVTNQSGIGRGYYSEQAFWQLTEWMLAQFEVRDVIVNAVYFSPNHAEHGIGEFKQDCEFRKPNPGMLLKAAAEHQLDLSRSVMVGDKISDMQAAERAGLRIGFLLNQGDNQTNLPVKLTVHSVKALSEIHP